MNKKSVDVLLYCDIGKREPVKSESTQSHSYFSTAILFIGLTVVRLDLWRILYFSHWGPNVFSFLVYDSILAMPRLSVGTILIGNSDAKTNNLIIDLLKPITKDEDFFCKGQNICNSFIVIT